MKNKKTILFCGTDCRISAAARCFNNDGYLCSFQSSFTGNSRKIDNSADADMLILPIPSFKADYCVNTDIMLPAEQMFSGLNPGTRVFGAMIPDFIYKLAREYNISLYDYASRDDFAIMNAIPTAEAAIMIASELSEKTIFGSNYTVVGYGRIGKALSSRLSVLGGNVTVATRSVSSRVTADCDGYKTVALPDYFITPVVCDTLFNTVPCRIIGEDAVKHSDARFIDLASLPGGFSKEAENILGDKLIRALALPGKYSPQSAGEIIYKTIKNMIDEIGG